MGNLQATRVQFGFGLRKRRRKKYEGTAYCLRKMKDLLIKTMSSSNLKVTKIVETRNFSLVNSSSHSFY